MTSFKKTTILFLFICLTFTSTLIIKADIFPKHTLTLNINYVENRNLEITLLFKNGNLNNPKDYEGIKDRNGVSSEEFYEFLLDFEEDGYISASLYKGAPFFVNLSSKDNIYKASFTYLYPRDTKFIIYDKTNNSIFISEPFKQKVFNATSEITLPEDYLNNSYDMITVVKSNIVAYESINISSGLLNNAWRIFLTVLIEIVIFILFLYKEKRSYLIVLLTNLATQTLLIVGLFLIQLFKGPTSYIFYLLVLEVAIFIIEPFTYVKLIKEHTKKRATLYALLANLVTLFVGFIIFPLVV